MLIEVQGLSKRYRPRGPMVVEEVSFSIDRGETLAIFGDSGSGKSTIGQILAGIYPATAGEAQWRCGAPLPLSQAGLTWCRAPVIFLMYGSSVLLRRPSLFSRFYYIPFSR